MLHHTALERARKFVFDNFERILVLLLVTSLVLIHRYVDDRVAFLNFYYLPVILAGFHLGRRGGVYTAVLVTALVAFFQATAGLTAQPGLAFEAILSLLPWSGFLVLTGYMVGRLGEQRNQRVLELTEAYITMLEILTFHLESSERQGRGTCATRKSSTFASQVCCTS